MTRFDGRKILVTGAGSEIGELVAKTFVAEGASIVVADADLAAAQRIAAGLHGGDRVIASRIDVSDRDSIEAVIGEADARFGGLDGLVNGAGLHDTIPGPAGDPWNDVLGLHLTGTFNLCRAFAGAVNKRRAPASIVNLCPTATLSGSPNRSAYVSAKHGLSGLTQQLALEFGPFGIRINAVTAALPFPSMPGSSVHNPSAERDRQTEPKIPLGRLATPQDVVAVVRFLLSEEASFITGATVPVDGGFSAGKLW